MSSVAILERAIQSWLKEKREAGEFASYELFVSEMMPTREEFESLHDSYYYTKRDRKAAVLESITMPGEEWRPVKGASRYLVSSLGRVWSLYYGDSVMKPSLTRCKYPTVNLKMDDGTSKRRLVHRLVAEAFIPNPEGLGTVDHINEDHNDNRVANLRWLSQEDNTAAYMRNHGLCPDPERWYQGKPPKRYPRPADTPDEQWRNVSGWPEFFVSTLGRVWSPYEGRCIGTGNRVCLQTKCARVGTTRRMIVAVAFLEPKQEGQVLRHKNGNKEDCRAENLYWADKYRPKKHYKKRGNRQ